MYETPVAADGDWILLGEIPPPPSGPDAIATYEWWNVISGARRAGWKTAPGSGDFIYDIAGDWIATVRVGQSLPFVAWQLILRNLETGEAREVAHDDARVADVPGLPVGLPAGFAPTASMSGSRLVWAEFFIDSTGKPKKRLQLYDLGTEKTTTLLLIDPMAEDIWQPSVGGSEVAWVHRPRIGPQELVVLDLDTGRQRAFPVGGNIFSCALSSDGRYLAWDDGYLAKYALDVGSGERVLQYAADEGWGTARNGDFVSWQPSAGGSYVAGQRSNGDAGYYDFDTREVRFVSPDERALIITGSVMGHWFVWQERPTPPVLASPRDAAGTAVTTPPDYFYFLRLPKG